MSELIDEDLSDPETFLPGWNSLTLLERRHFRDLIQAIASAKSLAAPRRVAEDRATYQADLTQDEMTLVEALRTASDEGRAILLEDADEIAGTAAESGAPDQEEAPRPRRRSSGGRRSA